MTETELQAIEARLKEMLASCGCCMVQGYAFVDATCPTHGTNVGADIAALLAEVRRLRKKCVNLFNESVDIVQACRKAHTEGEE